TCRDVPLECLYIFDLVDLVCECVGIDGRYFKRLTLIIKLKKPLQSDFKYICSLWIFSNEIGPYISEIEKARADFMKHQLNEENLREQKC
ncbi:unnamed protein product, partial [Heterotrigona itama]